jgi:hypothetical protein
MSDQDYKLQIEQLRAQLSSLGVEPAVKSQPIPINSNPAPVHELDAIGKKSRPTTENVPSDKSRVIFKYLSPTEKQRVKDAFINASGKRAERLKTVSDQTGYTVYMVRRILSEQ